MPVEPDAPAHPSGTQTVRRRIGDVRVSLRSELPQVLRDFARIYPTDDPSGPAGARAIEIDVRKAGRSRFGRRLYRVFADGEEIGGPRTGNGVFPLVEWGINLRVIATRSEFLQLHAASMACQGSGFVFAADSGSGKSTLAAILLARGWRYLCDEFALINTKTGALHPFPKALCIKAGAYPVVHHLGLRFARRRDYVKAFKGRVGYINPLQLGPQSVGTATPIRVVVLPHYRPGAAPALKPIDRARAALELYRCCLNKSSFRQSVICELSNLVRRTRCFHLTVGEPEPTARLLESQFGSATATATEGRAKEKRKPPAVRYSTDTSSAQQPTRREILRVGARLSYTAPLLLTLSAGQAMAAASNPSGICSTALNTGELCETDSDCCKGVCNLGVCQ